MINYKIKEKSEMKQSAYFWKICPLINMQTTRYEKPQKYLKRPKVQFASVTKDNNG